MSLLDLNKLFESGYTFPWEFIGMDLPRAGPVHSYIAEACAPYSAPPWREFLLARPTLGELRRAAKEGLDIAQAIVNYCEGLSKDRTVADQVVSFLAGVSDLRAHLDQICNRKLREGLINPPARYLSYEGQLWQAQRKG